MNDPTAYTLQLTDGRTFGPANLTTLEQWAREGRVPRDATILTADDDTGEPVLNHPRLGPILSAPPTTPGEIPEHTGNDTVSQLIPYRNTPALLAYYLGIFALVPLIGVFAAVPAVFLGIIGLRKRRAEPAVRGMVHAWVGIILGALLTTLWTAAIVLVIVASVRV